jgi:hypothetical protein
VVRDVRHTIRSTSGVAQRARGVVRCDRWFTQETYEFIGSCEAAALTSRSTVASNDLRCGSKRAILDALDHTLRGYGQAFATKSWAESPVHGDSLTSSTAC